MVLGTITAAFLLILMIFLGYSPDVPDWPDDVLSEEENDR